MTNIVRPLSRGIAALSLLSIGFTAPAMATSNPVVSSSKAGTTTRTVEVSTADLNLNSQQDRAIVKKRIAAAARQACNYDPVHGLYQPEDYTRCYITASQEALAQVPPIQTAAR